MSRQPQHGRRRGGPRVRGRVHAGGGGDVVGQEGGRHRRLCVEVGHPGGGHRHVVVVVEAGGAVLRRREARRHRPRPLVVMGVDVRGDRGDGGRRGTVVLGVPQAEQFLDRERGTLHWKGMPQY